MNLFDTSEIPEFPSDVLLGWSTLQNDLSPDILSGDEQAHVQGFTNQRRRNEFLTARHLFRFMAEQAGWNPDEIHLKKEELGKPFVDLGDRRAFVSLSHSNELVVCAISESRDIGLDVEHVARVVRPEIIKRILSLEEWDTLGKEDPVKLWTMKEAAVKKLGTGLRTNLNDLEMTKGEGGSFSVKIDSGEILTGVWFEAEEHSMALVW